LTSALDETDRRFLRDRQLRVHAGAGVHHQRQRDRKIRLGEEGDVLLHAVFEDVEVPLLEVGDIVAIRVGHAHVQRHQFDARAKWRLLLDGGRLDDVNSDNHGRQTEGRGKAAN
jgi:hypothetical protein